MNGNCFIQSTFTILRGNVKTTKIIKSLNQISSIRKFSVCNKNNMRFVQFQLKSGGPQHVGAQLSLDGDIFDISGVDSSIPNSLVKCLNTGNGIMEKAKRYVLINNNRSYVENDIIELNITCRICN